MEENLINNYLNSKNKTHHKENKLISKYISKLLLSIIFFMISTILIKQSTSIKSFYEESIYNNNLDFMKYKSIYDKYFGNIIPIDNIVTTEVFNENLSYNNITKVGNIYELETANNYMVPTLKSGVIVYLGTKDNYDNTCIIEGVDGINISYSNINIESLKLYDYIEEGSYISTTLSNKLYLSFEKDGEYITYEDFEN